MKSIKNSRRKWQEKELKWLEKNYSKFTYGYIANKLNRTEHSIKDIVVSMGWGKLKPRWLKREEAILQNFYKNILISDLSRQLHRTENSIRAKLRRLKMK